MKNNKSSTTDRERKAASPAAGPPTFEQVRDHRTRQASIACILEATFGSMAECNPDLWDRRAYLMLVGLVYDRLADQEREIPTVELVTLAKILAESRRAQGRPREGEPGPDTDEPTATRDGPLPVRFADVVRQVYGTNFQKPGDDPRAGRPNAGAD